MNEIENMPAVSGLIREETSVKGFILFELTYSGTLSGQLREIMRTTDIIVVTNTAERYARSWPGVKFYVYSGITGKWYAYFKPIQGV